jgi:hypothetical protein
MVDHSRQTKLGQELGSLDAAAEPVLALRGFQMQTDVD